MEKIPQQKIEMEIDIGPNVGATRAWRPQQSSPSRNTQYFCTTSLAAETSRLLEQPWWEVSPWFPELLGRIFAGFLLILSLPLMLVIALIIRLDSPGPIIFRQVRLGQDRRRTSDRRQRHAKLPHTGTERRQGERRQHHLPGRPFMFYKFRTMRHDARQVYPHLYAYDYTSEEIGAFCFKIADDPRLTRFGRFIRKTSLDELPNLINVVKGDMALVGPLAEIPEMAKYYHPWQELKFKVKPGITGYAQTGGRGLLSFQETIQHDVEYVLQRSLLVDLRLLYKTALAVVKRLGAF